MSATPRCPPAPPNPAEAVPLVQAMHAALARLVGEYQRALGISTQEALAKATAGLPGEMERALKAPPEKATWLNLHVLAQRDPEVVARRWEEIKRAALDELRSGHRAATALVGSSPWERAQFLAIRKELAQEWKPRGGLEWQMVETMAQAQAAWHFWLQALTTWASIGAESAGRDCKDEWGRAALPKNPQMTGNRPA